MLTLKKGAWCLIAALCSQPALAQEPLTIRLVSPGRLDTPIGKKLTTVIATAFGRMHTPYTLVYNPAERAVSEFKAGNFDGDVSRAKSFNETYPEAIRIDPPLVVGEFIAVGNHDSVMPKSWADLNQARFGYLRGSRAIEANTRDAKNARVVDSHVACLGMLRLRRLDLCVGLQSDTALNPQTKTNTDEFRVVKFAREGSYIWLGPSHQELAKRLSATLSEMEKSGELKRLFK